MKIKIKKDIKEFEGTLCIYDDNFNEQQNEMLKKNLLTIGNYSTSLGEDNISIGRLSSTTGMQNIAIGLKAKAFNSIDNGSITDAIAIGNSAEATRSGAISIGYDSTAEGYQAIGLGTSACVYGDSPKAIAIGGSASVSGSEGIAIGYNARVKKPDNASSPRDFCCAIQIGEGENKESQTLQVFKYQLLEKYGRIPKDRLSIYYGYGEAKQGTTFIKDDQGKDVTPLEGTIYFKLKQ